MPERDVQKLVAASRSGVLLDTQVLLLFLIGRVDESLVERCSRLRAYTAEDFHLLRFVLADARAFVVTPHVATETWDLGKNALNGQHRQRFIEDFVAFAKQAREKSIELALVTLESYFRHLGPADATIARLKRKRPVVITDDSLLHRQLESLRVPVVNFTHLRTLLGGRSSEPSPSM